MCVSNLNDFPDVLSLYKWFVPQHPMDESGAGRDLGPE